MRKRDLVLLFVLCACVVIWLCITWIGREPGETVRIRIQGKVTATYPLDTDRTVEIQIPEGGSNVLVIKDGAAYMEEADCPDGICVNHPKISRAGESIICIPHELVVEVTGSENSEEVDVIVH